MMRLLLSFVVYCLLLLPVVAQTPISDVINVYTAVSAINACGNELTVDDAQDFAVDMEVIIVQMKGAQMDQSNEATFGSITNMNQAGSYEWAKITAINGNELELSKPLFHDYQISGKVQLVSCPVYENAEVIAPLKPLAWNGNIGGVLALKVNNELTLSAAIDVQNTGFRGGTSSVAPSNNCSWTFNVTDYFYEPNNWRGSLKGEGIVDFINNKEAGRGPQANGGGGGNDHNSGGGGGANVSNGGLGGENDEPSLFGCDGHFPGLGGRGLDQDTSQVYLGGGGGAGHTNNNLQTDGGAGGGIAFLLAKTIIANNHPILAQGESRPINITQDGGGGGGAGGTVVLMGTNLQGSLEIHLEGGAGGSIGVNGGNRCMGPGGGGSGGRLLTNLMNDPMLAVSQNGGQAGLLVNSSSSCNNSSLGAAAGAAGMTQHLFAFPQNNEEAIVFVQQPQSQSTCEGDALTLTTSVEGTNLMYQWQFNDGTGFQNLSNGANFTGVQTANLNILQVTTEMEIWLFRLVVNTTCFGSSFSDEVGIDLLTSVQINNQPTSEILCEGTSAIFQLAAEGIGLTYQWQINNGSGFMDLLDGGIYSGTQTASLAIDPVDLASDGTQYRCIVDGDCGEAIGTNAVSLTVLPLPNANFTFATNGLTVSFIDSSNEVNSYLWNFGDNNTSNQQNPSHQFAQSGTYEVQLTVVNDCGQDVIIFPVTVSQGDLPSANFTANATTSCAPSVIQFLNNSSANSSTYQWSFPGGNPASSVQLNPLVSYANSGVYTVQLISFNPVGSDTLELVNYLTINEMPTVDFSSNIMGNTVGFSNLSLNATTYQWVFGDGTTSMEVNPNHTFPNSGIYVVTLTATNDCGSVDFSQVVEIMDQPTANFTSNIVSGCAPMQVQFQDASLNAVSSWNWTFAGGEPSTSTAQNPLINYPATGTYNVSLVVTNAVGTDQILVNNYVTVGEAPTPNFNFSIIGNTVDFTNLTNDATNYTWDFGDNNSSIASDPQHSFSNSGTYTVSLTASNDCGSETTTQTIVIEEQFIVDFNANATEACAPTIINYFDQSSAGTTSWNWTFPGGEPATSTQQNPTVVYLNAGTYEVGLEASNGFQSNNKIIENYLTLVESPSANFDYTLDGNTVSFTNNSTNGLTFEWDFGDGSAINTEFEPVHDFSTGLYNVTLLVDNGLCSSSISVVVDVNSTAIHELDNGGTVRLFPNPIQEVLYIAFDEILDEKVRVSLHGVNGQILLNDDLKGDKQFELDLSEFPAGIYLIRLQSQDQQLIERVVKY